jgi:hypothetical protein
MNYKMELRTWQRDFIKFVNENENSIINLYGYPYGKTTMSLLDTNPYHVYYHDDLENESIIHM